MTATASGWLSTSRVAVIELVMVSIDHRDRAIAEIGAIGVLSVGTELQTSWQVAGNEAYASVVVVSITVSECSLVI
jgi:hypothetical protein